MPADARCLLPVFLPAWLLIGVTFAQAPAPPGPAAPPAPGAPAPQAPSAEAAPPQATAPPAPSPDPAASTFATGVGLLLVPVRADKATDYEATEGDAKGNAIYVHTLFPVVPGNDYRPSLWLDQLVEDAPTDLLARYKAALAGSPTRLSLAEVAHMGAPPVKK